MPREGDDGLSDTVKQLSLLVGAYSIKFADFVKEKDAEGGYSQKLLDSVKDGTSFVFSVLFLIDSDRIFSTAIEQAKSSINKN
jgi:hypothetical protein